jgi:KUP system potassium uptake protein
VPLLGGAVIVVIMLVWHEGRRFLAALNIGRHRPFEDVWPEVERHVACRTPGAGVFMASSDDGVPPVLLHHVKLSRALHKHVILLTVKTADRPRVELRERLVIETLHHGFVRVTVFYGYMEEPDVPRALKLAAVRRDLDVDLDVVTWYLAREHVVGGSGGHMGEVTERLFSFLQKNAVHADRRFQIPPGQVLELGQQVDL